MEPLAISPLDQVFVLTGAGISAESGLATFRASDGLWEGHRIEDVCTPEAWDRNPALVWEFYSARRVAAAKAQPNPAHHALAKLEHKLQAGSYLLCTQNVDDLHEQAGSRALLHMHGELFVSRCSESCGQPPTTDRAVYPDLVSVSHCSCGALLRPHIVWFGEMPMHMDQITDVLRQTTLMLVVGTSGSVYPAASFVRWARQAGARTVYVGPEEPLNTREFSRVVLGKAGEALAQLLSL